MAGTDFPRPPINRRTASIGAGGCLALIAFGLLSAAFSGFIIMVLWGAIAPQLGGPTIGYGTAVLVAVMLSVIGGFFKSRS